MNNGGAVFRISPDGGYTNLYFFSDYAAGQTIFRADAGWDGQIPGSHRCAEDAYGVGHGTRKHPSPGRDKISQ